MKEHDRAKEWRLKRNLSVNDLAELTGYGPRAIHWLEKGLTPPNGSAAARPVKPWVWQRWKMMCAGAEAQLRSGKRFDW